MQTASLYTHTGAQGAAPGADGSSQTPLLQNALRLTPNYLRLTPNYLHPAPTTATKPVFCINSKVISNLIK
jgi:hypothetical protein